MCTFAVESFDSVRNNGRIKFYKVLIDGNAQIDSFVDEISKDKALEKEWKKVLACMDYVAETNNKLPSQKLNSIKDGKKEIAVEFKSSTLRIYCFKKDPNVFIILGGYKKNQKDDINKLKRLLKVDKELVNTLEQLVSVAI